MMNINSISSPIGEVTQLSATKKTAEAEPQSLIRDNQSIQADVNKEKPTLIIPNTEAGRANADHSGPDQVDKAVAEVNEFFQNEQRKLSFSVNEALEGVIIEVKNSVTDEVIRQIPPETVVKLAERLSELNAKDDEIVGVFLKERA